MVKLREVAKAKRGRPVYVPTDKDRATVKAMVGYGIKQHDVAAVLGIHDDTLRKYYGPELATAMIEANAAVAQSLFWMATKGRNVAAAIFWAKTRMGWKDPVLLGNADDDKPLAFVLYGEREARDTEAWQQDNPPPA